VTTRPSHPLASLLTPLRRSLAGVVLAGAVLALAASVAAPAQAQIIEKDVPADARGLDVIEKPGAMLPLDVPLIRSDGKTVQLAEYFKAPVAKPTILALVYYSCPVTCSAVMDKLTACMRQLDYAPGTEYNTLLISFDPDETTKQARDAKEVHLAGLDKELTPSIRAGYEFFTTDAVSAKALADATGFKYRRLENGQYSHPVCIFVITPDGKVSRYIYGFDYPVRDIKLALLEAGEGKVSRSLGERVLMFCYMYDPTKGRFTLQAMRVMQAGGLLTMTVVFATIGSFLAVERIRRRRKPADPQGPAQVTPEIVRVSADGPSDSTASSAPLIPGKLA